ncbi:hypothetical protein VHEMI09200 [[Torrubiella] hemipterigena]|uniref:Uncharacterized protein n=1 Tax=[Torrubiella] hemipterigena TaxID=1531966 RepID=A0A0A1T933_9HYPO|nr:hypothetical protein VHEMI09200 [[Torrubiella] hemipterigena]
MRFFWCECGVTVPEDTIPRCAWCRRRHLHDSLWWREWQEVGSKMPFFEDDPCYPLWVTDENGEYPKPYPKLRYSSLVSG